MIISPAAKAPERVIYSSLFVDQQLPKRVGLRLLLRAKLSHGAAVAENQLWAQELTFDERPPMTLGNAAAAHVRLIVCCLDCHHQVEPDPAEMAARYGAEMTVPDWHAACLLTLREPKGGYGR